MGAVQKAHLAQADAAINWTDRAYREKEERKQNVCECCGDVSVENGMDGGDCNLQVLLVLLLPVVPSLPHLPPIKMTLTSATMSKVLMTTPTKNNVLRVLPTN